MSSSRTPSGLRRLLGDLVFLLALSAVLGCLHHAVRADRPLFVAPTNPGYGSLIVIGPEEVKAVMADPKTVLVDARSEQSFRNGTIPGSRSLTSDSTFDEASLMPLAVADRVIVFCSSRHCNAAKELALRLRSHGITRLRVYAGGMAEWKKLGYPVAPGDSTPGTRQ